jgi:regulator of telomere elongation helicase 1
LWRCRYKDELGHAIVNFARVVPDGLLVFFPAYGVMQSCLDHWKASSGTGGAARAAAAAAAAAPVGF